jgi:hypothetical protein
MNQINPLHIASLLLITTLFLFFKIGEVNDAMNETKTSFLESEKLAVNLSTLKHIYADKKKNQKSLEKILMHRSLQNSNLKIQKQKKNIKISTKSIDTKSLNYLMGKILNASFNITMLKIKKLSKEKASLEMEIKW